MAYIKLSESATTTRAAVDQIVDGLNSFDRDGSFSTCPFVFKDVARAKADPNKRTVIIEMFQSYQNSIIPSDTDFGKQIRGGFTGLTDQANRTTFLVTGSNATINSHTQVPKIQFGLLTAESNMPSTGLNGTFLYRASDVPYEDRAPAAAAFFSASISRNTYLAGPAKYEVGSPWEARTEEFHGPGKRVLNYDSYSDWSEQLRKFKDYSIVPEYRISEEMSSYIGINADDPFFDCPQDDFLKLTGSSNLYDDSSKNQFYEVLSHSDFMKNFNITVDQLVAIDGRTIADEMSLTCKGVKKILPYEGFYPAQRINQLAGLFDASYGTKSPHLGENYIGPKTIPNYRNVVAPFFAPGIAFNSVKSGIAVDYPLFVPKQDRPFIGFSTAFFTGQPNKVIIGRGEDWQHVLTGSAKSSPNGGISFAAWIYPTSHPSSDRTIISFGGSNGTASGIRLYFPASTGSLRLQLIDTNGDTVNFAMP
ncbi:MAG: hypothetical protein VXY88_06195, partial [Bacteroidota bacterium]|nr:hypothetical protein [Bacteroidota bacterium]